MPIFHDIRRIDRWHNKCLPKNSVRERGDTLLAMRAGTRPRIMPRCDDNEHNWKVDTALAVSTLLSPLSTVVLTPLPRYATWLCRAVSLPPRRSHLEPGFRSFEAWERLLSCVFRSNLGLHWNTIKLAGSQGIVISSPQFSSTCVDTSCFCVSRCRQKFTWRTK